MRPEEGGQGCGRSEWAQLSDLKWQPVSACFLALPSSALTGLVRHVSPLRGPFPAARDC